MDDSLAKGAQQNQAQLAGFDLLVVRHQLQIAFDAQSWPPHRQTCALEQSADALNIGRAQPSELM